jgi:hypothetical protein
MASRTVERFDHSGLFMVRLHEPSAAPISREEADAVPAHLRPALGRAKPSRRQGEQRVLHRYCSGCSRETVHVRWPSGGSTKIPLAQWPALEPARGTTICQACGEWRADGSRSRPLGWSSWPRKPEEIAASRNGGRTEAEYAPTFDEGAAQEAAENEGMPPRLERSNTRVG